MRELVQYVAVAYVWTWTCWIGAWLIASSAGDELATMMTVFELSSFDGTSSSLIAQVVFAIGVYGPLVAYLLSGRYASFIGRIRSPRWIVFALCVPFLLIAPGILLSALTLKLAAGLTMTGLAVATGLYFVSNLITSGTEEFGWRGYLYGYLKRSGETFWDIAWKGGLLWAVWHYPLLVMLYAPAGIVVMIPSMIGFTASIVAMSFIANYLYDRTGSIMLAMMLHALNNTASFLLITLYPDSPFIVLSALAAWMIVWFIERKTLNPTSGPVHSEQSKS